MRKPILHLLLYYSMVSRLCLIFILYFQLASWVVTTIVYGQHIVYSSCCTTKDPNRIERDIYISIRDHS